MFTIALRSALGSVQGEWVEVPNAADLSDVEVEVEAAADALGAMTFIRPEDGAFNPRDRGELFFVTTGQRRRGQWAWPALLAPAEPNSSKAANHTPSGETLR